MIIKIKKPFPLFLSCIIWVLFYIPYLPYHILHPDNAGYVLGTKMMVNGSVPYLDFWDNKPPLIYFLYKLLLKIFGQNNFPCINYVALFFYITSTIFIYLIIKKLVSRHIANAVVIAYPFIANLFIGRDTINPNAEIYMLSFALASLFFYFKFIDKKPRLMLIPGLLLGVSTAFKQPSVFYFPVMILMLFIADKKAIKKNVYRLIYIFLSICGVWLATALYFYSKNALWDFWFSVFGFNFLYCGDFQKHIIMFILIKIYYGFLCSYPLIFPFYLFGLTRSLYLIIRKPSDKKLFFLYSFLILWHFADISGVSQGGLFYYHYFIQLIPSMTAITLIPCLQLLINFRHKKKVYYITGASIVMCVLVYLSLTERDLFQFHDPCKYTPPQKAYGLRKKIVQAYGKPALYFPYYRPIKMLTATQSYIKKVKQKAGVNDSIFIWGNLPEMYLLANRKPASRFIYASFITGQFYGLRNLFYTETKPLEQYLDQIKKLLFDDFSANPPKVILVSFHKRLRHTEFFWDYLRENYDYVKTDDQLPLDLYVRKQK